MVNVKSELKGQVKCSLNFQILIHTHLPSFLRQLNVPRKEITENKHVWTKNACQDQADILNVSTTHLNQAASTRKALGRAHTSTKCKATLNPNDIIQIMDLGYKQDLTVHSSTSESNKTTMTTFLIRRALAGAQSKAAHNS